VSGLLLLALTLALRADAAVRDANASANLAPNPAAAGQYLLTVANLGPDTITSVTLTSGPAFRVTSIVSAVPSNGVGSCAVTATGLSCNVALAPPPCTCNPGDQIVVTFTATGDAGGTTAVVNNAKSYLVGGPAPTTPPTQPPATPPPTKPHATSRAVQKLRASIGPGAHITFARHAKAGATQITVRDRSATDNFHFAGPGVNKTTGVRWRGTVTWTVTLKRGTYTFNSDAHPKLQGRTRVA
jgi:hypothetical protein